MPNFQIGCGQITWHVVNWNLPEDERMSSDRMLAEIAQAGYEGAPAGPSSNQSTEDVLANLQKHGLKPAPGYLGEDFWDPAKEAVILEKAKAFGKFHQAAGVGEVYVAAGGFDGYVTSRGLTRRQVSGHVTPEDYMTDEEFQQFGRVLNRVGEITLEYGVKSCFHNHVASTIETGEEIDRLFSMVDRDLVFMGPDTGHLLWGGVDVLDFCRKYANDIKTIHIKDVNETVLKEGIAAEWGYEEFSEAGIWNELGEGCIDFPALFELLEQAGFNGWVIVETDVTQLATPLESAIVSRNYLKQVLG
ncbi:MAG: TIM barrel protein [Chloroflexota bacterium]